MERTANHPFLVQLIASRLFESRDLGATLDQVAADEMVANFFAVDFQTLDPAEQAILEDVAREGRRGRRDLAQVAGRSEEAVEPLLYGLTRLGYLTPEMASIASGTGSSSAGCDASPRRARARRARDRRGEPRVPARRARTTTSR